jgi:hypothetical protein
MRGFATVLGVVASLVLPATVVFAAEARTGRSGLAVGIFLGFCALIVVAQLLPALRSKLLERRQSAVTEALKRGDDH